MFLLIHEERKNMFQKIKYLLNRHIRIKSQDLEAEEGREFTENKLIEFYDSDGQKVYIEREEFRTKVLPYHIQRSWNDPQTLYNVILGNMDDFPKELEEAAKRQLEIDTIPERGHIMASLILMKNNKFVKARQILENYIATHGSTAAILTNLAKTYDCDQKSEEILWKALQVDPNFKNGLDFWLAIRKERDGEEAYQRDLKTLAQLPTTWLPQLYLCGEYLRSRNLEKALPLIHHVLATAPIESDSLAVISGDLGKNGYVAEIIEIILPRYNHACGEVLGVLQNILQAFYELDMVKEGVAFIDKLTSSQPNTNTEPFGSLTQVQFTNILNGYAEMFRNVAYKEELH